MCFSFLKQCCTVWLQRVFQKWWNLYTTGRRGVSVCMSFSHCMYTTVLFWISFPTVSAHCIVSSAPRIHFLIPLFFLSNYIYAHILKSDCSKGLLRKHRSTSLSFPTPHRWLTSPKGHGVFSLCSLLTTAGILNSLAFLWSSVCGTKNWLLFKEKKTFWFHQPCWPCQPYFIQIHSPTSHPPQSKIALI